MELFFQGKSPGNSGVVFDNNMEAFIFITGLGRV